MTAGIYPFPRASSIGFSYGQTLTSAHVTTIDANAAAGADGSTWSDSAIAQNWPFSKTFAGFTSVGALLWDPNGHRWHVFGYDGSNNPLGQRAFGHGTPDSWASMTIPAGATLRPKCAATNGSGVLVMGGEPQASSNSKIRESSDGGVTWNARTVTPTGTTAVQVLIWHAGKFIAGLTDSATTNIETSTDGQTWTQRTGLPNSHPRGSFASNGTICVCTARNTSTDQCITSEDGVTWTARGLPTTEVWSRVVYDSSQSRFLAFGATNLAHSSDGVTWNNAGAHGRGLDQLDHAAILGRVFCIYDSINMFIGHYADGTITTRQVLVASGGINGPIAAGSKQFAAATDTNVVHFTLRGGTL